jgi:hypothetical protein
MNNTKYENEQSMSRIAITAFDRVKKLHLKRMTVVPRLLYKDYSR